MINGSGEECLATWMLKALLDASHIASRYTCTCMLLLSVTTAAVLWTIVKWCDYKFTHFCLCGFYSEQVVSVLLCCKNSPSFTIEIITTTVTMCVA